MENDELSDRIAKLEKAVARLQESPSAAWQRWLDVLSKLLLPLLLFWLAFALKDSVQQALEARRLEVTSAGAIEQLLTTMHKQQIGMEEATAAALTLSAYGEAAIMPLVEILELGSSNTETAAKQALFILGLSHPDAVTRSLGTVLDKKQKQFRWQTHQTAIEIVGKIAHPKGKKLLLSYAPLLERPSSEGLKRWANVVREANKEDYEQTQQTMSDALGNFNLLWEPSIRGGKL